MAAFYQKFLRRHLDLSSLSVMRREDNDPYFCTPKGASIFGWAGVDGIHFCFVRGFGETVFAVSPMNGGKDCVHVIARDFSDFLRLLLATGDSAALEQAWQWDEAQFDAFLAENPPTDEKKAVLSAAGADSLAELPQAARLIIIAAAVTTAATDLRFIDVLLLCPKGHCIAAHRPVPGFPGYNIFEEGRYLHTSTVIAIHGVTPQQIRFETMNSHYCLLAPSSPVAADVPVAVTEQAA